MEIDVSVTVYIDFDYYVVPIADGNALGVSSITEQRRRS